MKKGWVKLAIGWAIVPVAKRNKAAETLLRKLASGATWIELIQCVAQMVGYGSYVSLLEKPAKDGIRQVLDEHDGPDDLGVSAFDALLGPFEESGS